MKSLIITVSEKKTLVRKEVTPVPVSPRPDAGKSPPFVSRSNLIRIDAEQVMVCFTKFFPNIHEPGRHVIDKARGDYFIPSIVKMKVDDPRARLQQVSLST